ncbi:MAG TPA: NAD(P)/FAD-dependent oxidoreductase [Xanthobacteraceae bacterium]|jgi:NADH dehydrogenase
MSSPVEQSTQQPKQRPQVVIVGAGFGGLEACRALSGVDVDITLVDAQNHHCFQPLLYQVATAALSPGDIAWPIRAIVRGQKNVRVIMAQVTAIEVAAHRVHSTELDLPYDYLVLATGATHSYFGHDDWAPFAPGLKHISDATEIRRRFLLAFEHAEVVEDKAEQARLLTFVIVGGGATGVEMAGAIAEVARRTLQHDFRRIDPRTSRIILIEAGPRLLPAFPPSLSDYARRSLQAMGVEVELNRMVTGCDAKGVMLGGDRIEAATVIWAAGVVASPAANWLNAPHDRAGRIQVSPDLSVPGHNEIFAVGDTALVVQANGKPVPGIAAAAKQMGRYVGGVIAAHVARRPTPGPFVYRHLGDLATIGRKSAVVKLGVFQLTGFLGWLFWSAVHIYFLIGLRNRFVVALNWLWSYLTFQRGARLIGTAPR